MYYDFEEQQQQHKKSYLDLFLDNSINPKKRGVYFGQTQEDAIIKYNTEGASEKEKNDLFKKTIAPAFRKIISGVLEMPNFRHLGRLNRDEVIDNTFFRLIEKIGRFKPGMIGKSGAPVKAYSYFSTIAKHYILEQKIRNEKILKNKADVESSIDLTILSEDTLKMMSNYDKHEVEFDDYEIVFKNTKDLIIKSITDIITIEEEKEKKDSDLIKLGYILKYLIEKWDKIEFLKKNEFMRILTLYTGFPHQKVSFLFKRFKISGLKKLKISPDKKNEIVVEEISDEVFEEEENPEIPESYQINSFEEFEQQLYRHENNLMKQKRKKNESSE